MDLNEAVRYAHCESSGPHASQQALGLLAAEIERLRDGIREVLGDLDGAPCSFWACPGADHPSVAMATCNVCDPQQQLHELLGDPAPTCTALECDTCGRESPWCEECDEKLVYCAHSAELTTGAEVTS